MERDSALYKMRRTAQAAAHHMFPDETMSKIYYRIVLKKRLELENPQTFNEKLQWLKLYVWPNDPLVVRCTDKYTVRGYVKEKGFEDRLVPLLGVWDSPDRIDWDALPEQFVLKCSHGCAYNIIVEDKSGLDRAKAERQLGRWLKEDFGAFNIETHYSKIRERRIICESFLGAPLTDYKFFCFHGKPEFIYISRDLAHDRRAQIGFFYLDGRKMPLKRDDYADLSDVELPDFYGDMLKTAAVLSKDFPFVRVDFLIARGTYYFSELTFTPSACMMPIEPQSFDKEWGKMLDISRLQKSYGRKK